MPGLTHGDSTQSSVNFETCPVPGTLEAVWGSLHHSWFDFTWGCPALGPHFEGPQLFHGRQRDRVDDA